jgi:hypothetical protein
MKLDHPRVSALVLALAASQGAWCADGNVAGMVSENVAAMAQKGSSDKLAVTPEVSTLRAHVSSNGPVGLTTDGRTLSELAGVNYRVWMSHGRAGVGVGVGTLGYITPRPDGRIEGPVALTGASPTVSVGLRYRVTPDSTVYADASGVRNLGTEAPANYVNTKVGMEWKPAKRSLGFDHGAIGMTLDSGYKLSLKPRHGGLGVYLRGQF